MANLQEFVDSFQQNYKELCKIRESIVKLCRSKRTGSYFESKIQTAKEVYNNFKENEGQLVNFKVKSTEIDTCSLIEKIYLDILSFETEDLLSKQTMSQEKFSLRTATSLLPKSSGDESTTLELIDAIELYESMLDDDGQKLLINFVLKTRISSNIKMRLSSSYSSVANLVRDMRLHLLTRKSDTALQAKLQIARQGDKSVRDYGKEIESLFTDLTISQAEGNEQAYTILRPLNERNAIKRFAEGLRSQRIGTIVTARNLSSLKEAIRVAEDEARDTENPQVMSYNNNFRMYSQNYSNRSRGGRGRGFSYANRRGTSGFPRFYQNDNFNRNMRGGARGARGAVRFNNDAGGGGRGRGESSHYSGQHFRGTYYNRRDTCNNYELQGDSLNERNTDNLNQFFRE